MFDETKYFSLLRTLSESYPKRDDGRIDYSQAKKAAVITIFLSYNNTILLLKRSNKVLTYKGKWNTVAGYLDELVPIHDKIYEELNEELQITRDIIKKIHVQDSYTFYDQKIQRTWIIFPVLVTLKEKPEITLDWEHTDYRWINAKEIHDYDTVPNAQESLTRSLTSCSTEKP